MIARRWLINLALLVVLAGLVIVAQVERREVERGTRLTSLAPEAITRLELHRAGEPVIRLQRGDDGWQMLAPFAVAADPDAIDKLLPVVDAQVSRTLPAAGLDLGELGLEPAPLRLLLDGLELGFGGTEPVAAQRYVQVGDMVHLTDDRFLPRLMTPAIELVSRHLLPPAFSPGLGDLDGAPVTADSLAPLAEAVAVRVERPAAHLDEALGAALLRIASADGGDGIEFLVSDGGTRWTRLDAALSWLFATAPLDAVRDLPPAGGLPAAPASPPGSISTMPGIDPLEPAAGPASAVPDDAWPEPAPAGASRRAAPALPVERLAPPMPGTEPVEQRPTAAIPNLRELAPARAPDPSALPQTGVDPFAPTDLSMPEQAPTDPAPTATTTDPNMPLRTEKLRP